jgi:hypothetical protein
VTLRSKGAWAVLGFSGVVIVILTKEEHTSSLPMHTRAVYLVFANELASGSVEQQESAARRALVNGTDER